MELSRPLSTITPTLDGDVLAELARQDAPFTTGDLHRVLAQYSEAGIRNVLHRLTRQGIVDSDKVGNAYNYRLNRHHLAAEHIIMLADLMSTFLARLADRLETWEIPPVYAAVFGSAARGSMTVDGYVDLMLVRTDDAPDELWAAQVDDLIHEVTRWIGNDTRPLQFTEAELVASGPEDVVLEDVLNDGLTVAGSLEWLTKQLLKRGPEVQTRQSTAAIRQVRLRKTVQLLTAADLMGDLADDQGDLADDHTDAAAGTLPARARTGL